jgi:hypothetical protein
LPQTILEELSALKITDSTELGLLEAESWCRQMGLANSKPQLDPLLVNFCVLAGKNTTWSLKQVFVNRDTS